MHQRGLRWIQILDLLYFNPVAPKMFIRYENMFFLDHFTHTFVFNPPNYNFYLDKLQTSKNTTSWKKVFTQEFSSTEMQVMDLFELNDHFYNDDPDVPFWEFQLKVTKAPSFGSDPNQKSVFIKNVPLPLSRADFVKSLSQMAGYVSLTLSEPNKLQNYTRIGWASFDGEEYCNHCVNQESITIKGHVLQFQKQKEKKQNAISDVQLGIEYNKLLKSLQQQRELIKVWMRKKEQVVVPQLMDHQKTEITQHSIGNQLDIQTLYLRRTIVIGMELNSQTIDYLCLKQAIISSHQTKKRIVIQSGRISLHHEKQYWEYQQSLRQQVIDQSMAANHRIERIRKSTIQRQIFAKEAIVEAQLQENKVQLHQFCSQSPIKALQGS